MTKKYALITASAQGLTEYDDNGRIKFQRYDDTAEQKFTRFKSARVQETSDSLHLNFIQRQMYRRVMYGLKEYTPEQISSFSPAAVKRISEDNRKSKHFLHIMKAKRYYHSENKLFNAIFPKHKLGTKDFDWIVELPKSATLHSLGITTKEVIEELILRRLLPQNFFKLTPQSVNL